MVMKTNPTCAELTCLKTYNPQIGLILQTRTYNFCSEQCLMKFFRQFLAKRQISNPQVKVKKRHR